MIPYLINPISPMPHSSGAKVPKREAEGWQAQTFCLSSQGASRRCPLGSQCRQPSQAADQQQRVVAQDYRRNGPGRDAAMAVQAHATTNDDTYLPTGDRIP